MNDYQRENLENADETRYFLGGNRGSTISVYRGREILRQTRVNDDNTIEVLVGGRWLGAFVSPSGLRKLIVRC